MTGREVARRWDLGRRKLREQAARRPPRVLTEYPFEVFAATVALAMGIPLLIGISASTILVALVGKIVFYVWASALTIGGATMVAAFRGGRVPVSAVMAPGLQLVAGCFAIYSLAVVIVLGWFGVPGLVAYALLAIISWARASHFRRIIDIQRGARRLQDGQR